MSSAVFYHKKCTFRTRSANVSHEACVSPVCGKILLNQELQVFGREKENFGIRETRLPDLRRRQKTIDAMIDGFELETAPLTDDEKKLVPIIIAGLNKMDDVSKALHGKEICKGINVKYGANLTEPRLRKITNFIRSEGILPVIATSKGYYISRDKDVIRKQVDSLDQRIAAIEVARNGLKKFLEK